MNRLEFSSELVKKNVIIRVNGPLSRRHNGKKYDTYPAGEGDLAAQLLAVKICSFIWPMA
ncbi:hypothetical protein AYO45_04240 [Gammaproteobacteria bacterium SCGC AG-212-F23]|nr:hypothetical protein AYO45_04240 [Gammaproteobacteria bacterium SCGC AG-212-F23]